MHENEVWLKNLLSNELASFVNKAAKGDEDVTLAVHSLLILLATYSKAARVLEHAFFLQNKTYMAKKLAHLKLGAIMHEMSRQGCSQRQAFKFFAIWLGLGERQVANYYYKFRKEFEPLEVFEKSNEAYYLSTLPFFSFLDVKEVKHNAFNYTEDILPELPNEFPVAKKAYEKAYKRFKIAHKEFEEGRKNSIS